MSDRVSSVTYHAVTYQSNPEGFVIDPDQTITAETDTTPKVDTAPPVNVDAPVVTGTGEVGQVLSCTMGNWQNEPTTYEYAWLTDGLSNSATPGPFPMYNIVPGDSGCSITCVVTAVNAVGSTAAPPSNAILVS